MRTKVQTSIKGRTEIQLITLKIWMMESVHSSNSNKIAVEREDNHMGLVGLEKNESIDITVYEKQKQAF